jgi:hypothetical protein
VVVDAEKKEPERKRKRKTLLSEKKEVRSKKSLTGSTLLEMSGKGVTGQVPLSGKTSNASLLGAQPGGARDFSGVDTSFQPSMPYC